MGAPPNFLLDTPKLKGMILENKRNSTTFTSRSDPSNNDNDESFCDTQRATVQRQTRRKHNKHLKKNNGRVVMKRRRSNLRRRDENGNVERKVQTLKRLIPSRDESDQGSIEGLFRDTASYIISLQMRVRVMQIMVDVLENSQDDDHE